MTQPPPGYSERSPSGPPPGYAPPPYATPRTPLPLPRLLPPVVVVLGLLSVIWGFLGASSIGLASGGSTTYSTGSVFYVLGWAPALLLVSAACAAATLLPAVSKPTAWAASAAAAVGGGLGALFYLVAPGSEWIAQGSDNIEESSSAGLILLVIFGLLQVAATLVGLSLALQGGPRPARPGRAPEGPGFRQDQPGPYGYAPAGEQGQRGPQGPPSQGFQGPLPQAQPGAAGHQGDQGQPDRHYLTDPRQQSPYQQPYPPAPQQQYAPEQPPYPPQQQGWTSYTPTPTPPPQPPAPTPPPGQGGYGQGRPEEYRPDHAQYAPPVYDPQSGRQVYSGQVPAGPTAPLHQAAPSSSVESPVPGGPTSSPVSDPGPAPQQYARTDFGSADYVWEPTYSEAPDYEARAAEEEAEEPPPAPQQTFRYETPEWERPQFEPPRLDSGRHEGWDAGYGEEPEGPTEPGTAPQYRSIPRAE